MFSERPLGTSVAIEQLERDPHAVLARLRRDEPVSWIDALGGWLVTRYDLAVTVMRDDSRFTVDDPRFSTSVVVGPSMLSLDGEQHELHRGQFAAPFRPRAVRQRFAAFVEAEVDRLIDALVDAGGAELRRSFAGPLAAATVAAALGFSRSEVEPLLSWYDEIVEGVSEITAGRALPASAERSFAGLRERLQAVIDGEDRSSLLAAAAPEGELRPEQVVSNAAVLLFGGIETSEGMVANAVLALLTHQEQLARVRGEPELVGHAIDESLRFEPAAAMVDRYATENLRLAGAEIAAGDLVHVSITAANRDPAMFTEPDSFVLERPNSRRHLAFAQGPHVCLGVHLARLEARAALSGLLARLPRLRLDRDHPAEVRGLVFRKPPTLHVRWD